MSLPIVYVAHGGGPMPLMGDPSHLDLTTYMMQFANRFPTPKKILVVTAHWEAPLVTVTGSPAPGMLFDYYGFPPETYELSYPAPGDEAFAQQIIALLKTNQIEAAIDNERGFDHGTFVPLMLMYPEAQIPVVQMSLRVGLDPLHHIKIGEALAVLREQEILILGSGLSFHNMRAFFAQDPTKQARSEAFDNWLTDALCNPDYSPEQRSSLLARWLQAPEARFCHPREEHLLPLHVCLGAAGCKGAEQDFRSYLFDTAISGYLWR